MAKVKLLSMTDYAKSRGLKLKDVKKAIADGIISPAVKLGRNQRKLINATDANRLWDAYLQMRDPNNQPPAEQSFQKASSTMGQRHDLNSNDDEIHGLYTKARASKETMAAKIAQVKYEQLTGSLCETDEVKRAAKLVGGNIRNAIMNMPNKLAPLLAAETDVKKVKLLLEDELRSALLNLSRGDYDFLKADDD